MNDVTLTAVQQAAARAGHHAPGGEKIHALTSLRFFAALFVVAYHAVRFWSLAPGVAAESLPGRFFGLGYMSVSFFFLLSGYILAVVYLRRGKAVRARSFYQARIARVYPLLLLTLLLDTPFLIAKLDTVHGFKGVAEITVARFAGNAALLSAWIPKVRGLNDPSWSLSVEAIFYLCFPLLGTALWKLRGIRLWVCAAVVYAGGQGLVYWLTPRAPQFHVQFSPLLHLPTFALGILLARWQSEHQAGNAGRDGSQAARYGALLAVLAVFAAVVLNAEKLPFLNLNAGLLSPLFAAAIWAFSDSRWLPAKLVSPHWLVILGEASFGLYLFHQPVFHLFAWLGWSTIPWIFPVYLATTIGASLASFYWFETPARRWVLKLGKPHVKETMEMASDAQ